MSYIGGIGNICVDYEGQVVYPGDEGLTFKSEYTRDTEVCRCSDQGEWERLDNINKEDTKMVATPSAQPSSLHTKLAEVQGLIVMVAKDGGRNTNQNYDFVNEGSFLRRLKPLLAERGLSLVVSFDLTEYRVVEGANNRLSFLAIGTSTATLTDAATGESLSVNAAGIAHDTGDKAVYKAQTGGAKYAYWKMFSLATGDDPEKNSSADEGVTVAPKSGKNNVANTGGLF